MSGTLFDVKLPLIIVEVQVEKAESVSLSMVLDTGASFTIIPYEIACAIGCDPASSPRRIRLVTGSGIEIAPVVIISSIKALGKEIKNFEVACHDLPQESLVDGLLGLNFLKNFDFSIKFKTGIVKINNRD